MNKVQAMVEAVDGGVCKSLDELALEVCGTDLEMFTTEELADLDEALFCCDDCGWTMPTEEMSDDDGQVCMGCRRGDE